MATLEGNRAKLAEADAALDVLEGMTGQMVNNADNINHELKDQNAMIDKTNDKMDTADQGIVDATKKVEKIGSGKLSWPAFIVLTLEIIAIIIIFVV